MSDNGQMTYAAIIVAAGRGARAGGSVAKQWQLLGARRVIDWSIDAFRNNPAIGQIAVVLHPDELDFLDDADVLKVVGGDTRAASVRAGLEALAQAAPDAVLIHDAARATVPEETIAHMCNMLKTHSAAAPGLPVTDALWSDRGTASPQFVSDTVDRAHLYRAQTPQAFHFAPILAAHRAFGGTATDDVEVARAAGIEVSIGPGHPDNIKITTADDFARAERILRDRRSMDIRTGNGFDVHRFGNGDQVTLCGVTIPHERGLQGHSDADVGLHAITDAIYGALAEGDIGRHFPPSDPQWKGADSRIFLEHAAQRAKSRGFAVTSIDCTLICETPKIGPHADAMRNAISEITGIASDRISVKATTSEQLGFTGRKEGIAASATATLVAS